MQDFADAPDMVGDSGRHRRGLPATIIGREAGMRRTEVGDRPHHIHPADDRGHPASRATRAPARDGQPTAEGLREWCYDAPHKAGSKRGITRDALEVTTCFLPLMRWVLTWWASDEHRLALDIDASTLGQRFTVLAVSLISRGCAIPIAWAVVPATHKGAWRPHWERVLRTIHPGVPADWTVIILADRGLYAKWRYHDIVRLG